LHGSRAREIVCFVFVVMVVSFLGLRRRLPQREALAVRLPGRWVLLGLCTAVAGVGVGLAVSGAPQPWSSGGRALPPARARVYEDVDACLLTGSKGLADPSAAQAWAGMEDASLATSARVSYLAVTGPATVAQAEPFAGSLLVGGCKVVVASGAAERSAALAEAARFSSVRFVVTGAAAGTPPNVTALAFTPSGLRSGVASAVEAGVHAEGG
jgi:hypothetical protein